MNEAHRIEHLVIVTCGRTGSTLLQHVLNGVPEVMVRGENDDFCFWLYRAYRSLVNSKKVAGVGADSRHPYFGAEQINLGRVRGRLRGLIGDVLRSGDPSPRILGFKEVKFLARLQEMPPFVNFLDQLLAPCGFIFLYRNVEEVAQSFRKLKWFSNRSDDDIRRMLEQFFAACRTIAESKRDRSFEIDYADLKSGSERLAELFAFFGLAYEAESVNRRLGERCSY